jgi:putative phosphoribosyl transferase
MPTRAKSVMVGAGDVDLPGELRVPGASRGTVVFVHGSGSSRLSPRNIAVATHLNEHGCATLLFDLLTSAEAADRRNVFDIPLLAGRVEAATAWLLTQEDAADRPAGYFGASTGAAAALLAAAAPGSRIAAVVSRGGRPDLAEPVLGRVRAPTLLLVGSRDEDVLALNRRALRLLNPRSRLVVVEGATHLFEEPGTLEQVAAHAAAWFVEHFTSHRDERDED